MEKTSVCVSALNDPTRVLRGQTAASEAAKRPLVGLCFTPPVALINSVWSVLNLSNCFQLALCAFKQVVIHGLNLQIRYT